MLVAIRFPLLLLAAFVASVGCRAAWPFAARDGSPTESQIAERATEPSQPAAPVIPPATEESQASFTTPQDATTQAQIPAVAPSKEVAPEQAFAQVLGDIQELGRTDPAAQQQLLRQLESAKPAHYPLVVQQFKAAYAYSRELRERNQADRSYPVEPLSPKEIAPATPASQSDDPSPRLLPEPTTKLNDPRAERRRIAEPTTPESKTVSRVETASLQTIDPRHVADSDALAEVSGPESPRPSAVVRTVYEESAEPTSAKVVPVSASTSPSSDTWEEALDRAIYRLSTATRNEPQSTSDLHARLRLRLLELAAGRQEAALEPVDGLSNGERDYWSKQLFALSTMLDHETLPDDKRRAAAACLHLTEATSELGELCPLAVRNLTFCSQVHGYGAYEPLPGTTFQAGERLTLYVEVDNSTSVSTPQGFHTSIVTNYEILDATGNRLEGNEFPTIDDYCLRRRRDFYSQYGISLPKRLEPGKYQLKLSIKDQHTGKLGNATIEFDIAK